MAFFLNDENQTFDTRGLYWHVLAIQMYIAAGFCLSKAPKNRPCFFVSLLHILRNMGKNSINFKNIMMS